MTHAKCNVQQKERSALNPLLIAVFFAQFIFNQFFISFNSQFQVYGIHALSAGIDGTTEWEYAGMNFN